MKEWVGDSDKEYLDLKKISPIFEVNALIKPLYIIHGEIDTVVDIEHAYRLKLLLEKNSKAFEWRIVPKMGHSFETAQQGLEVFSTAVDFINRSLGLK